MHLTDIRIDEIVKVKGLRHYPRGLASFSNRRSYDRHLCHSFTLDRNADPLCSSETRIPILPTLYTWNRSLSF